MKTRLSQLGDSHLNLLLCEGRKGIEKESLRVTRDGRIAQTPHPSGLGSALTHAYVTTDYSEALLELITPPFADIRETLEFLEQIHKFVYDKLENELLWVTSMPCLLDGPGSIPIAQYGTSNRGMMKHVYRRGLEYRYGRSMQAISGVHFNYSLPEDFWPVFQTILEDDRTIGEFISDSYFGLIRNFQRLGWLIPYLFGASPAVCKSFFNDPPQGFELLGTGTYYQPYATSLRMSDIGYKNKAQANLKISYNNIGEYVDSLTRAIETPDPEYEQIGVFVDGEYRQLNSNVLQIENEYYSFVRPKQIVESGEKPTLALKRRGVRYVEIRALDVDLFDPHGVNEHQLRFLETFLIFCLLQDSPPMSTEERKEYEQNQSLVACCGRDPKLKLQRRGSTFSLRDWAMELCEAMQPLADLLDQGETGNPYAEALDLQRAVVGDVEKTPSARLLRELLDNQESFFEFALNMAIQHEQYFRQASLPADREEDFERLARESLERQKAIEDADRISFEEYLQQYFAQS